MTRTGHVSALHRAAYCGHCNVIRLLLKYGALTSLRDADGKTALHKVKHLPYCYVSIYLCTECYRYMNSGLYPGLKQ